MSATAATVTPINGAPSHTIPSFYLRLAEIQGEIARISKTGHNREQGYKFVEESAIMDAVKPLLTKAGIFMTMRQVAGSAKVEQIRHGKNDTQFFKAEVGVELAFIDGHSDAREVYPGFAYALDTGDKALQKALTSAGKYAVLKAFLISTGEDLDRDGHGLGDWKADLKTGNGGAPKATHKQLGFVQQLVKTNALSDADLREIIAHESGRAVADTEMSIDECSKVIECIKAGGYMAWLTRIVNKAPAAAPAAAKPAVDNTAIVSAEQVKKLRDKFAELGASDADIAKNVSNYTSGGTNDIAKMRVVDATRMFQMLMRGEYVPAD